jgi:hypothetical protein
MLLETFYVGPDKAYRSAAAIGATDGITRIEAPAGARRLWRLEGEPATRPYVTADWAMAWKLYRAGARRISPLEVIG